MENNQELSLKNITSAYTNNLIVTGIFLILLTTVGHIIRESFSEEIRYDISHNLLIKNVIIFFMIFFTISFSFPFEKTVHPMNILIYSIIVWFIFTMFVKLDREYIYTVLILLVIYYVIGRFEIYYKKNDHTNDGILDTLFKIQKYLITGIGTIILTGYIIYIKNLYVHDKISVKKLI